jgi:serine/threonine-protein kinase
VAVRQQPGKCDQLEAPVSSVAPLQRGDVVAGKYTVDQVIGSGGMGYVVLATHPILGACAIKLLHPDYAQNAEMVARFVREAQAAQRIQNEHVVRVSDVGVDPASRAPYIVMERLQGQDLQHVLQAQGRLPVEHAVEFVLQACEALAEAHIEGIVHRDLKPANLFVTSRRDGSPFVKVLDFGISKMAAPAGSGPGGESGLTRTTGVMGTVLYMSPEQLQRPKEVDARSDIWALGVILYELLSGKLPFVGEDMPNTCIKVMLEEPEPLSALRPDVPASLLAVVARCLRKNRDERFAHVSDFASALLDVATPRGRASIERIVDVGRAAGHAMSLAPQLPRAEAIAQPTSPAGTGPVGAAGAGYTVARTTTGGAVSALGAEPNAGVATRSRAPFIVAGFAVVGLLGGGAAFALSRDGGTTTSSSGAEASEAPRKPKASSSSPASSPSMVGSAEPSASASASVPAALAVSTKPAALVATVATAKAAVAATKPTTGAPSIVSPPPTTAPTKPAAAVANCEPPYVYDAKGMKHYKPGCE